MSWKTSLMGLGAIVCQVLAVMFPQYAAQATKIALILSGGGLMAARDHTVTSEQAGLKPDNGIGANVTKIVALAAVGFVALSFMGCAPLQPGTNALVVRVEQTEAVAPATFDLVLQTDDLDRAFWKDRFPAFHTFAEGLRAPVGEGTNALPRCLAVVRSLDTVKLQYQAGLASSNAVVAALTVLETLRTEAAKQLGAVTNQVIAVRETSGATAPVK